MPTRSQVWTWIAAFGLLVPSVGASQDQTEREVVELIVRDGPQARAIRCTIVAQKKRPGGALRA